MTIKNCPSCGFPEIGWSNKDLGLDEFSNSQMVMYKYQCDRCNLQTRWQHSLTEARMCWNEGDCDWTRVKSYTETTEELA